MCADHQGAALNMPVVLGGSGGTVGHMDPNQSGTVARWWSR